MNETKVLLWPSSTYMIAPSNLLTQPTLVQALWLLVCQVYSYSRAFSLWNIKNGHIQNLKQWYNWTYLQNRNRLTAFKNKFMATKGEMWGER